MKSLFTKCFLLCPNSYTVTSVLKKLYLSKHFKKSHFSDLKLQWCVWMRYQNLKNICFQKIHICVDRAYFFFILLSARKHIASAYFPKCWAVDTSCKKSKLGWVKKYSNLTVGYESFFFSSFISFPILQMLTRTTNFRAAVSFITNRPFEGGQWWMLSPLLAKWPNCLPLFNLPSLSIPQVWTQTPSYLAPDLLPTNYWGLENFDRELLFYPA